jgi:hypothetical protein
MLLCFKFVEHVIVKAIPPIVTSKNENDNGRNNNDGCGNCPHQKEKQET